MKTQTDIWVGNGDEIVVSTSSADNPTVKIAAGDLNIFLKGRHNAYRLLSALENYLTRTGERAADEAWQMERYEAKDAPAALIGAGSEQTLDFRRECPECADHGFVPTREFHPQTGEPDGMTMEPCPTCQLSEASG